MRLNKVISFRNFCFSLIFIMAIYCSGCSTILGPLKPTNYKISNIKTPILITIMNKDFEGNDIDKSEIKNLLTNYLNNSGIYKRGNYKKCSSSSCPYYNVGGIKTYLGEERAKITYYYGDYFPENGTFYKTETVAEFPIEITNNDSHYIVKIKPPSEIKEIPARSVLGIPIKPYCSINDVEKDINKIFNDKYNFSIQKTYSIEFEINSKYSSESIYANFERKLGNYGRNNNNLHSSNIKKNKVFKYIHNEKIIPIIVSVYPYRDGSKVVCKASIPYEVRDKVSLKKSDILALRENITNIVND